MVYNKEGHHDKIVKECETNSKAQTQGDNSTNNSKEQGEHSDETEPTLKERQNAWLESQRKLRQQKESQRAFELKKKQQMLQYTSEYKIQKTAEALRVVQRFVEGYPHSNLSREEQDVHCVKVLSNLTDTIVGLYRTIRSLEGRLSKQRRDESKRESQFKDGQAMGNTSEDFNPSSDISNAVNNQLGNGVGLGPSSVVSSPSLNCTWLNQEPNPIFPSAQVNLHRHSLPVLNPRADPQFQGQPIRTKSVDCSPMFGQMQATEMPEINCMPMMIPHGQNLSSLQATSLYQPEASWSHSMPLSHSHSQLQYANQQTPNVSAPSNLQHFPDLEPFSYGRLEGELPIQRKFSISPKILSEMPLEYSQQQSPMNLETTIQNSLSKENPNTQYLKRGRGQSEQEFKTKRHKIDVPSSNSKYTTQPALRLSTGPFSPYDHLADDDQAQSKKDMLASLEQTISDPPGCNRLQCVGGKEVNESRIRKGGIEQPPESLYGDSWANGCAVGSKLALSERGSDSEAINEWREKVTQCSARGFKSREQGAAGEKDDGKRKDSGQDKSEAADV